MIIADFNTEIDENIFNTEILMDLFDDPNEIKTLIDEWKNNIHDLILKLTDLYENPVNDNQKIICNIIHTIKGSSAQIGAVLVGDTAKNIELNIKNGSSINLYDIIAIKNVFDKTINYIENQNYFNTKH